MTCNTCDASVDSRLNPLKASDLSISSLSCVTLYEMMLNELIEKIDPVLYVEM